MSEHEPINWLPKIVDPRKLVATASQFKRNIRPSDMPRIAEASLAVGEVSVDLLFDRDEQGRPELTGSLHASLSLECQRCLEPVTLEVDSDVHLAIVWDEAQAKALPKSIDPWIVDSEEEDLAAIIEEEIFLQLPVVARHEHDCLSPELLSVGEQEDTQDEKQNPFSVLAKMKDKP